MTELSKSLNDFANSSSRNLAAATDRAALDAALVAAHEADDRTQLVALYTQAADQAGDVDAACFYLTQAYVFALQTGDASADDLHRRLKGHGREE